MAFASKTKVPIYRSQAEIQKILSKYNATAFAFAERNDLAVVQFEMNGKRIKFIMQLPTYSKSTKSIVVDQIKKSKWRALVLTIKAKLESIEARITTFEQEFMAHIVLPNGATVGDSVIPYIEKSYKENSMTPLLEFTGSNESEG